MDASIPFDFVTIKIIIEPNVGLVDVTMNPLWNFQSNICPETKVSQEKVICDFQNVSSRDIIKKHVHIYVARSIIHTPAIHDIL